MTTKATTGCSGQVRDHSGHRWYLCSRTAKLVEPEHEGGKIKGWCRQHAPSIQAAKSAVATTKYNLKWVARKKKLYLEAAAPDLLAAAEAALRQLRTPEPRYGTAIMDLEAAIKRAKGDQE